MIGLAVTLPLVLLSVSDVGSVGVRCPKGFICQIAAGGCAVEHNVNQPNPYCSSANGTYGRSGSERLGVSMHGSLCSRHGDRMAMRGEQRPSR